MGCLTIDPEFNELGDESGQRNGRRRAELPHATRAFLQD
jgi:hypothetical protein